MLTKKPPRSPLTGTDLQVALIMKESREAEASLLDDTKTINDGIKMKDKLLQEEEERQKNHMQRMWGRHANNKKKRRKNKQPRIDQVFKKEKKAKNFQGKNIDKCRYHDDIGLHLFEPDGYTELENCYGVPTDLCRDCFLQPCIAEKHKVDITNEGRRIMFDELDYPMEKVRSELLNGYVKNLFVGYFGKRYTNRVGVPPCVRDFVEERFPTHEEFERDQSEDEVELSAGEEEEDVKVGVARIRDNSGNDTAEESSDEEEF